MVISHVIRQLLDDKALTPNSITATETLLFKSSVEIFEQLKASTMKPMAPRQQYRSCDLRVLETTTKEGWRTTRRLVISSSAAEKKPWCTELFLPLSRVQINREGLPRQAVIKWSDCTHEKSDRTDGNYNTVCTLPSKFSPATCSLLMLIKCKKRISEVSYCL